jgi:hypothetical protein
MEMTTVTFEPTKTVEPTKVATVADRHLREMTGRQELEGDFAQGMRTLAVSDERSDYARGLRTLPMDLDAGPDFARGQRQGPLDPRMQGDFAAGQRGTAEHDR